MSDKPITARAITISLYWHLRSSSDLLLPRYTPRDWWECDLWRLTKAGFVDEYEIKLSVSDFKADMAKAQRGRFSLDPESNDWKRSPDRNKHEILAGGTGGPNRFWFVMPVHLADQVQIPSYAGLIVTGGHWVRISREAPKRHAVKWDGDRTRILQNFYHRYWSHEAKAKPDAPIEELKESEA